MDVWSKFQYLVSKLKYFEQLNLALVSVLSSNHINWTARQQPKLSRYPCGMAVAASTKGNCSNYSLVSCLHVINIVVLLIDRPKNSWCIKNAWWNICRFQVHAHFGADTTGRAYGLEPNCMRQLIFFLRNTVEQVVDAAVCISGQLRTFEQVLPSLKQNVLGRFNDVHIYAVVTTSQVTFVRVPQSQVVCIMVPSQRALSQPAWRMSFMKRGGAQKIEARPDASLYHNILPGETPASHEKDLNVALWTRASICVT